LGRWDHNNHSSLEAGDILTSSRISGLGCDPLQWNTSIQRLAQKHGLLKFRKYLDPHRLLPGKGFRFHNALVFKPQGWRDSYNNVKSVHRKVSLICNGCSYQGSRITGMILSIDGRSNPNYPKRSPILAKVS
jgi:hypothetical protein